MWLRKESRRLRLFQKKKNRLKTQERTTVYENLELEGSHFLIF